MGSPPEHSDGLDQGSGVHSISNAAIHRDKHFGLDRREGSTRSVFLQTMPSNDAFRVIEASYDAAEETRTGQHLLDGGRQVHALSTYLGLIADDGVQADTCKQSSLSICESVYLMRHLHLCIMRLNFFPHIFS